MKNIVIDTCTVIHIVKGTPQGISCITQIEKFDPSPNIIISVVSMAELHSFSIQNKWGKEKVQKLEKFLEYVTIVNINAADRALLDAYVSIDGYSKRKLLDPSGSLMPGSARKMGKNDLWIAATALVIDAPLVTTDGDFDHLNGVFMEIIKVV